ncbi:uncharacterized protein LOC118737137 [Rhagoletis pomonella]|uniref:uncharacterized protein LOC118737137 n=1 Tax=Rhagoletis pomonella TaxID=28610 RepID=UPI0017807F48|nr:uncharacterized protein LOC118737137 [Rhagoletis pomonella]XP_036323342.1 uncharacterized protein LOC118737137 [Rhagoletis pomonella]XP_036323343.1 uncharacterized protein LOC118737137 [Rhagoletis pomonella]XP_036323344.1 uncharacterized protein LOC118737137 [Rhagoletis pomonella]XP_036323346.1 uncharacterized protein LOC118737137 [Rhagoletis pomonella]
MAASVLFACGLNEQKLPNFVHISEESNVDGSFLISCILGQRLRISNAGTVLVCLQHNYQHYFHAGMRLGYNVNLFLGKTLNVIDPLTEIGREGINCKWLQNERNVTTLLLDAVRAHINASVTQRNSTTIIIDNLAILFNLGATKQEVLQLCHELAELPKQYANLGVITKMSNCDLYEPVDNNVAKLGTLRIRAAQLKSGVSRDVDGKLLIEREVIERGEQEKGGELEQVLENGGYDLEIVRKEVLYKVNDRNVKIMSPGEIGVRV